MISPHPEYVSLGSDPETRLAAYRELFRFELDPGLVDEIRRATNGNFALGDQRFAALIESTLGKRVTPGKSGRPRKLAEPESGELSG